MLNDAKKSLSSALKNIAGRISNQIHLVLQVNNATARVQTKKSGGKCKTTNTSIEHNSIPQPPSAFGIGNVRSELLLFFFWDAILDALGTIFLAKMQLRLNEMLGYDDFLFPFHKCIHVTTIHNNYHYTTIHYATECLVLEITKVIDFSFETVRV